jgi:hypothetical protein
VLLPVFTAGLTTTGGSSSFSPFLLVLWSPKLMNRFIPAFLAAFVLLVPALAIAHETRTVGEAGEQYRVIVGLLNEPAFTGERTGLDLRIVTADGTPVENLEQSLIITLTSPDGSATRELTPRARWGEPGSYVDDFILTQPGSYTLHVVGFINSLAVDLSFQTHDVTPVAEITFP